MRLGLLIAFATFALCACTAPDNPDGFDQVGAYSAAQDAPVLDHPAAAPALEEAVASLGAAPVHSLENVLFVADPARTEAAGHAIGRSKPSGLGTASSVQPASRAPAEKLAADQKIAALATNRDKGNGHLSWRAQALRLRA